MYQGKAWAYDIGNNYLFTMYINLATKYMYLYGAGGHSKVITDILNSLDIAVIGMFDDNPPNAKFKGIEVRDGIRLLGEGFPELDAPLIISVGDNSRRAELASLIDATFGTAIHSTAIVSAKASIGFGTVVLQGAIIQAGAKVGAHVLVNTAASIDHDNTIGDYAHISPHATLCGHVEVGEGTHIGAGAIVIPSIRIGRWCTIGAGAVVIRDIPDFATAVGNPARVIKIKS
jgi:sugar O-acyltransferase (sialic acid O-acetyltransferase NeuD family)|nr:acetyltransferase [Chamaesiphon sp. VAR_48_metabat_135_sub]